ncbi:MAG: OPT/YSL family transporter, partial [Coriobacteriales bacterium]|nr:OPT/YSL family transporter [Coriobacteriales bacterium]
MSQPKGHFGGQLTVRGVILGCAGCVVITAASVYTALKMGALPWPIVFAAIISLVFLRTLERWRRGRRSANNATATSAAIDSATRAEAAADGGGSAGTGAATNVDAGAGTGGSVGTDGGVSAGGGATTPAATLLNEANVTHTIMSAGAMVAGGLAFTIPGIWMLGHANAVSWWQMLVVALAGVALGTTCCVLMRRHFMEKAQLEFPIGQAAAQTLIAGNGDMAEGSGGAQTSTPAPPPHRKTGFKLFTAMGLAGVYSFLRDGLGVLPAMLGSGLSIPGVAFGIYNSPMLLAVGFLVGTGAVTVWFAGALLGNFGIISAGSAAGLWDVAGGQAISSSLGMGVMIGSGAGVIAKILIGGARRRAQRTQQTTKTATAAATSRRGTAAVVGLVMAAVACLLRLT